MRRIWLIAKRDYIETVRTKAFLMGLVLAPLLFGGGGMALAALGARADTADRHIAIIDHTGKVAAAVIQANERRNADLFDKKGKQLAARYVFESVPPAERDADTQRLELSEQVRHKQLYLFVEIPPDAVHPEKTGEKSEATYYTNSTGVDDLRRWLPDSINTAIQNVRLAELGVDSGRLEDIRELVPVQRMSLVTRDEQTGQIQPARAKNELESVALPIALMFLMFMIVGIGSGPMLSAVAEDKMQRVFEMLLGSASAFELIAGKVLAALGRSLTSMAFYLVCAVVVLQALALAGLVPIGIFPWFLVYLIGDVTMLCALAAALGAACGSPQEAQNLGAFLFLPMIVPIMLMVPLLQRPNSPFMTAMSLFPPFTPMLMLVRQALPGGVPAWEPWVGLVGMLACVLAITWGAARIFRVAILFQGKMPRMGELLRWAIRG